MPTLAVFRERFYRYAFRGVVGLAAATPAIAVFQGWYILSDFRKHHRDAPFPDMPCSGVVVVAPPPTAEESSWFSSLSLPLSQQKEPPEDPLRLLVVGDSLAAGVGVTKSGTPVLPEAIAKTLSSALGGRAVYWTCMGEPGLSSPQIVKELLLDADDESQGQEKTVDVMQELKEWWAERRQQQQQQQQQQEEEEEDAAPDKTTEQPPQIPEKVKAWWKRVRSGVQKDMKSLRDRLRISEQLPEPAVLLPRLPKRRKTVVPDLVAEYDVAVVITGFNDLKNLIFPLPEDPNEEGPSTQKQQVGQAAAEDGLSSNAWLEKDLLSIVRALRGRMRNYGFSSDNNNDDEEEEKSAEDTSSSAENNSQDASSNNVNNPSASTAVASSDDSTMARKHHPMVVFPATPLFAEKIYPLSWFAAPGVKIMEYQKKKLAEKYPAPVVFLEAPDAKTIKDFTNKRGPIWEARSREEVLFELTNKKRLEQLETLMKEYYDRWTVDVEEEEATFTYDAFGPDIQGPMQHLEQRSPLISPDRVHPSDEGYELWGRHIGNSIVKEWDRVDERSNR